MWTEKQRKDIGFRIGILSGHFREWFRTKKNTNTQTRTTRELHATIDKYAPPQVVMTEAFVNDLKNPAKPTFLFGVTPPREGTSEEKVITLLKP